jgi:membrane protease YdiL (CAAX protease family)
MLPCGVRSSGYFAPVTIDNPGERVPPRITSTGPISAAGGEPGGEAPGEAVLAKPVARWRWWVHLVVLGAYPLVIGGMAFFGTGRTQPALSSTVKGLLAISLMELIVFGAVFAVAWLASRASSGQLLLAKRLRWLDIPLSIAYSLGLRLGVAVVGALIAAVLIGSRVLTPDQLEDFVMANRPDVEALVDVSALKENPVYLAVNATVVSFIVAGFREELWRAGVLAGFCALWPARFGSAKGQVVAVGMAAILFGFGHFSQGALAVFLTAVLGFLLGLIMVYHKSIWPAVLAHGAFNATSFVILPWVAKYIPGM